MKKRNIFRVVAFARLSVSVVVEEKRREEKRRESPSRSRACGGVGECVSSRLARRRRAVVRGDRAGVGVVTQLVPGV
jgi:hypothetical protein